MKYVIVIPDGCADEPQEAFGGKTPLQAARTPHMDRIAQTGLVGRSNNVPASLTPASDVATLSLFGYDPEVVYTGRAPLEAAAMGVRLGQGDWAIRCNLVNVADGLMRDFTAGHISTEEARELIAALRTAWGDTIHCGETGIPIPIELHAGVQYRHLLVCRPPGRGLSPLFEGTTRTQPPHDIPDRPVADHLPTGPGGDILRDLMERSKAVLAHHPVNRARIAAGNKPATQVWLWGQGSAPSLRPFAELHHKKGAIISAVDLVRGVGILLGWDRIDVVGATGYLDTDGYLFLVDRVKDMIVTGGENVYSVEVENAIASHPAVEQVAAIGIPSEKWGEAVHAIVVVREGATVTESEIIDHAREWIAGYKLPKSVEIRTEPLPLSGAMKVLKRELRAPYWAGRDRAVN